MVLYGAPRTFRAGLSRPILALCFILVGDALCNNCPTGGFRGVMLQVTP